MSANLAKLHDQADKYFEDRAREVLSERLKDGKKVAGFDMWDLIDCELNSPDRYRIVLEELASILLYRDRHELGAMVDELRDGFVERFLESNRRAQDEILELAAEIEAERE